MVDYDFPVWLRITHYVNLLMITLLIRSGIQILGDHPDLYWNSHCAPGSAWLRFSKKKVPEDRVWTSMDEAVYVSPWIGLPGGHHTLGNARHWHFLSALFWMLNGGIYVVLMFTTGHWGRLIPTSWQIIPDAWKTLLTYLSFQAPPLSSFHPYDPLQQLAYAGVVFIVAPLTILTGLAMSPAIAANFPWYPRLFGGRQYARSIHFLMMVSFLIFMFIHISMVFLVNFNRNVDHMVLGIEQGQEGLAVAIGALLLLSVLVVNWLVTVWTNRIPRQIQDWIGIGSRLMDYGLAGLKSRQAYTAQDITPYFWVNGRLPTSMEWRQLAENHFTGWRLEITGLVENPVELSLAELRKLPQQRQITEHVCIQGWSGIAEWTGVPLSEIIRLCQPKPDARFIMFYSYQDGDEKGNQYYSSLTMEEALSPQTILAYEMNGRPLEPKHGAPLRLRIETKLGFKMTKWLRGIEFVADYNHVGLGHGGYREDREYTGIGAKI